MESSSDTTTVLFDIRGGCGERVERGTPQTGTVLSYSTYISHTVPWRHIYTPTLTHSHTPPPPHSLAHIHFHKTSTHVGMSLSYSILFVLYVREGVFLNAAVVARMSRLRTSSELDRRHRGSRP